MSSSPTLQRKLRSTISYPAAIRSSAASRSAAAPLCCLSTTHRPFSPLELPRDRRAIEGRADRVRCPALRGLLFLLALFPLGLDLGRIRGGGGGGAAPPRGRGGAGGGGGGPPGGAAPPRPARPLS